MNLVSRNAVGVTFIKDGVQMTLSWGDLDFLRRFRNDPEVIKSRAAMIADDIAYGIPMNPR